MDDEHPNTTITGPLIGPGAPEDDGADRLEAARQRVRAEDERNKESTRLLRRLIVAFILIVILGIVSYALLPQWGVRLHPMVPLLSFIAILVGALLTGSEREDEDDDDPDDPGGGVDEGCAVGMCPGPRPLKMFRDPPRRS